MHRTAALFLVLAGCVGADEPPADAHAQQVAMSIASSLRPVGGGGELATMLDAVALVRGEMPPGLVREDDRTVRGQRAGFSVRYELACRDDHNVPRACDRATDNADVDASSASATATRDGAWIVNDITLARARIDGEGHLESADHAYDASYRGIILVRDEPWPRAGLVRYDLAAGRRTGMLRAEARFAASGLVTIVLPDHAFELDLATGIVREMHDDPQLGVQ